MQIQRFVFPSKGAFGPDAQQTTQLVASVSCEKLLGSSNLCEQCKRPLAKGCFAASLDAAVVQAFKLHIMQRKMHFVFQNIGWFKYNNHRACNNAYNQIYSCLHGPDSFPEQHFNTRLAHFRTNLLLTFIITQKSFPFYAV